MKTIIIIYLIIGAILVSYDFEGFNDEQLKGMAEERGVDVIWAKIGYVIAIIVVICISPLTTLYELISNR